MGNEDGTITIGTQISTSQMESEMKRLYKELEKYDKEASDLLNQKANIEPDVQSFERLQEQLRQVNQEIDDINKKMQYESATTELGQQLFEKALLSKELTAEVSAQNEQYEKSKAKLQEINNKLEKNTAHQEIIKGNLTQIKTGLSQISSTEQLNKNVEKVGMSFDKLGSKVVRFGLSLFGVSTIYGALSKATHMYLNSNEELSQKLNSIWTALANLIGPIVEKIANWILKLVAYLNVFLKAVSNGKIDLSKSMEKNTKSIKGTTSAMKGLNRQMASFDEATKLQDTTSTAGGGIGDVDKAISSLNDINLDEGVTKKFENLGNTIRKIVKNPLKALYDYVYNFHNDLNENVDALHNEEDTLKAFRKVTEKSKQAVDNSRKSAKDNNLTTQEASIVTQNLNSKLDDSINLIKGSHEAIKETSNMGIGWSKSYKEVENSVYQNEKAIRRQNDAIKETILAGRELRINGKLNEEQQEAWKQKLIEVRNSMIQMGGEYDELGWRGKENIALINMEIRAINGIETQMDRAVWKIKEWKETPFVNKEATVTVHEKITASLTNATEVSKGFASSILQALKISIATLNVAQTVKSSLTKALGLAKGGIINLPGPGVSLAGGVVGGERGAEGVVPLTDSQQMEILGEAIGKYITINASITNTMNGRVISRELQKINNENDFARNG